MCIAQQSHVQAPDFTQPQHHWLFTGLRVPFGIIQRGSIISLPQLPVHEERRERLKSSPSTLGSIILCPSTDRSFLLVMLLGVVGSGFGYFSCCSSVSRFYFQETAKPESFCLEMMNIQILIVLNISLPCTVCKKVSFTAGEVSIFSLFYSQKLTFYFIP